MTGKQIEAQAAQPTIYPATTWQQYLLDEATHPDCTDDLRDRFILSNAFLVQPKVDLRRLRRAVEKLRERHDSLRIRLCQIKGKWRAVIDPPHGETIHEVDLGDLDDEDFLPAVSAIANAPMPLIDAPLSEVIVAHCGMRGDVLITRVHHAITDGYGMVVLTEDLTKFLIGLPVTGKAVSHTDYIKRFQSPRPSHAAKTEAFWEALHRDLPPEPNVGRKAKGIEPLSYALGKVDQRQLFCRATPDSLRAFEVRAKAANLSATTLLFAAYLEAICQCYSLDRLMFMVAISRSDPALDTYVGDHTLDPFLPYRSFGSLRIIDAAKALADTFAEAMAHLPSDAARRGTPYQRELIARGCNPSQFSVHQPRAMSRQDRSMFSEGFYAGVGVTQKIGPFTLEALDTSIRRRRFADMRLEAGSAKVRTGFGLSYDGISYTENEARAITDKICDLLDLDLIDTELT